MPDTDPIERLEKLIDMLGRKGLNVSGFSLDFNKGSVLSVQCMPAPWLPPTTSRAAEEYDPEAPDPRLEKLMYAASDG